MYNNVRITIEIKIKNTLNYINKYKLRGHFVVKYAPNFSKNARTLS